MKKLIFSLIATAMFSSISFANEIGEIKEVNSIELKETAIAESESKDLIEDDFWFCYETGRTRSTDFMTGDTIITVYVRCTWYSL